MKAEENGSMQCNAYQWSFGNGGSNNRFYGWPSPWILCGAVSSAAGRLAPREVKVAVVVNGSEQSNYIIPKPHGQYSAHFTFQNPLCRWCN